MHLRCSSGRWRPGTFGLRRSLRGAGRICCNVVMHAVIRVGLSPEALAGGRRRRRWLPRARLRVLGRRRDWALHLVPGALAKSRRRRRRALGTRLVLAGLRRTRAFRLVLRLNCRQPRRILCGNDGRQLPLGPAPEAPRRVRRWKLRHQRRARPLGERAGVQCGDDIRHVRRVHHKSLAVAAGAVEGVLLLPREAETLPLRQDVGTVATRVVRHAVVRHDVRPPGAHPPVLDVLLQSCPLHLLSLLRGLSCPVLKAGSRRGL
mmetsp:Transcript_22301/g.63786  ORF Transcript_22301/g.63786 Transcript_22301/m.63786 type:complete len:262 (+) Transcript_22301:2130-2915(+)